nr:type-2 ice-structuring protein [Nothobranchius furzeri]
MKPGLNKAKNRSGLGRRTQTRQTRVSVPPEETSGQAVLGFGITSRLFNKLKLTLSSGCSGRGSTSREWSSRPAQAIQEVISSVAIIAATMMLSVSLCVWIVVAVTQTADSQEDENAPSVPTEAFPETEQPAMDGTEGDYFADFTCSDGFTKYSTQCLLYVPQAMSWNEAKENCQSMGSSLASAFSGFQASEVHLEMKRAGDTSGKVWVGGHKSPEDVNWSWDGASYFNGVGDFCGEEPHENNCLEITADDDSACLSDTDCDTKLPSVCGIILM